MTDDLRARLTAVDERIADAARAAGRDVAELTRIVVTKFHPPELIRSLYELGVRDIAENRQQELSAKVDELGSLAGLQWHAVGQVQTNKARAVIRTAAQVPLVAHTLDRERLAASLDRAITEDGAEPLDVLIQVNLTDDPARGGATPADVEHLATVIAGMSTLHLRGVMAVAPLDEAAESAFARLASSSALVREVVPEARWISAGMSGDFEIAIAAGATHLRIGSAITGNRPPRG